MWGDFDKRLNDRLASKSGGFSSWDDIPDRPFGSEIVVVEKPELNVDWDGNLEGRATYRVGMEDGYCYVSDVVVNDYHDLVGATIRYVCDGETKLATLTEDMYYEWMFEEGGLRFYDEASDSFEIGVAIITKEFDMWDTHYPAGLYFTFHQSHGYVCNISHNNMGTEEVEVVTPIDVKYLPESHQFGVYTKLGVIVQEVTFKTDRQWAYYDLGYFEQFKEGRAYQVVVDGVTYNCVAYSIPDSTQVFIGNGELGGASGGNGEPFLIKLYLDGQLQFIAKKNTTYTVEILGEVEYIQHIDPKYLPSGSGAGITELYIESGNTNTVWKNPDDVGSDNGKASYDEVVAATKGIVRLVEFYYDETYAHDVVGFAVFSNAVELLVAQYSAEQPVFKYVIQK